MDFFLSHFASYISASSRKVGKQQKHEMTLMILGKRGRERVAQFHSWKAPIFCRERSPHPKLLPLLHRSGRWRKILHTQKSHFQPCVAGRKAKQRKNGRKERLAFPGQLSLASFLLQAFLAQAFLAPAFPDASFPRRQLS